ncbi:hypothetical protein [uncultured Helicobacter sp.]
MFWGGDSKKESGLMGRKGKAGERVRGYPPLTTQERIYRKDRI